MLGKNIMENKNNKISIICLGDIMPGGIMHGKDKDFLNEEVLSYLNNADIRVANLECAIGDIPHFDPEKMHKKKDIVYAPNSNLKKLKEMNINIVSLANNHIYDLGIEGLKNTIKQLDSLGIKHCGAGKNIEEASQPAVIEISGKTIAFIAFCDYKDKTVGYVPIAKNNIPGVNPLHKESLKESIVRCKNKYDYVYVIPHWGVEHTCYPTPEVWTLAEEIINYGANGVIGGHTHRVQPVKLKKNKIIIYSLGNFCFFDRYINKPRPTFYPPIGEDTSIYPITYEYPYVDRPTLKLWPESSRIGMIVKYYVDDCSNYECKYTRLCEDNCIRFYRIENNLRLYRELQRVRLLVSTQLYPTIYFIRKIFKKIKYKLNNGKFNKK